MDEKQRIREILKGNTSAFGYFVDTYQDMAVSIALRVCKNEPEAEDIAQNAFIKAFQNLHSYRGNSKFSTWFYRIVYNTALTETRKLAHKIEFVPYEHSGLDIQPSDFDTFDRLSGKERKRLINDALARIPEGESVALTLYYLEEMDVKEVARIMGLTEANIKIKLFRGRNHLSGILEKKNVM